MQVLTVLPKSWTARKLADEFGVSYYMARAAKKLAETKGVLATPNPKPGKTLDGNVIEKVKQFYSDDQISRTLPGKKDYVNVREDGLKVPKQKRLLLCNLREAYLLFKEKYPELKIGVSKFAQLRPKETVFPGSGGTHSVCVCTIHQNFKLMFLGANLNSIEEFQKLIPTVETGCMTHPLSYKHLIALTMCNPSQPSCNLGTCEFCPRTEKLMQAMEDIFMDLSIDEIQYCNWVSVDRTNLIQLVNDVPSFLDILNENLQKLRTHHFIAKEQARFLDEKKNGLKEGEVVVQGDFAENYTFVVQDAIQGYHWTNDQATLHPFVYYYKCQDTLTAGSFCIISDCLTHDTVAVHCFIKELLSYLKSNVIDEVSKIYYFTDGCAAQYKNRKNFINLVYHEQDFGVPAEWHFFATSHGKGPCDGIGGTVKRLAARASLQKTNQVGIQNAEQLYLWAVDAIKKVKFAFVTKDTVSSQEENLMGRFQSSVTIAGTLGYHGYYPINGSMTHLNVKEYSSKPESVKVRVTLRRDRPDIVVGRYFSFKYDENWWVGIVKENDKEAKEVLVSFMTPHGPARSFSFPSREDKIFVKYCDVLEELQPTTATGRVYHLTNDEMNCSDVALQFLVRHYIFFTIFL